jgi:CDP-6-deoxy-D-xylo-4-hexulose-3-dehydrase
MHMPVAKQWFYPTSFSDWGDEELSAISRVIASKNFTQGKEVRELEHEFASFHGMKHGIAVNSGSSANLIVIAALKQLGKIKTGDCSAVPAVAWSTTYAPLVQHGLDLLLIDIGESWNAIPQEIIHEKLVIGVPILGNPIFSMLWEDAAKDGGVYIEDCCESVGAIDIEGARCGTRGLMNTFSFYYSHQLNAVEGGMILTNDDECANVARMLRAHGWTRDVISNRSFDDDFDFRLFGYNVRTTEIYAAIAREQLKKLDQHNAMRRQNVALFQKLCEGLPLKFPKISGTPAPFGIAFMVANSLTRSKLAEQFRAVGIDCRSPVGGSFRLHRYGEPWANQKTPNADHLHRCGMLIGNAGFDLSEQIEHAVDIVRSVVL